jgi:hypothetical protein
MQNTWKHFSYFHLNFFSLFHPALFRYLDWDPHPTWHVNCYRRVGVAVLMTSSPVTFSGHGKQVFTVHFGDPASSITKMERRHLRWLKTTLRVEYLGSWQDKSKTIVCIFMLTRMHFVCVLFLPAMIYVLLPS